MAQCAWRGCQNPRAVDVAGHADGDFCLVHEAAINCGRRPPGVQLREVEAGPYRAEIPDSGDPYVDGPGIHLSHHLCTSANHAEMMAQLLNLAYAFGVEAGRAKPEPGSIMDVIQNPRGSGARG